MLGQPYVITFLKRKSESGVWIPYSNNHVTGHVVTLSLPSHVSGHVQSQVIPSHGFILLDCGAVTPQWCNQLQGSCTILPVLFWLVNRVVPLPLCYSDWLTESYHFPCVILIGQLDRTTLTCYSHWMLLLDVSQMFLSAVFHSTQQAALSLP